MANEPAAVEYTNGKLISVIPIFLILFVSGLIPPVVAIWSAHAKGDLVEVPDRSSLLPRKKLKANNARGFATLTLCGLWGVFWLFASFYIAGMSVN